MRFRLVLCSVGVLLLSTPGFAQYSEGFDSAAADIKINQEADTAVSFVDYGNFTRGGSTFMIPEAPRQVAGSAATSGLVLEANLTAGAAAGINVLAGATPVNFSGDYRLSYDVWLNENNMPFPSGSTEALLWGVGNDDMPPIESGANRGSGAIGTYGWLNNENGGATEDAAINENDAELADLGDTQTFENVPFDAAFPCNADGTPSTPDADPPNGAPMLDWVQVDIDVRDNGDGTSNVGVYFNFVEFFSENVANASVNGFAMLGYEDRFGSVNSDPDNTFGLFDNFTVSPNPMGPPTGTIPDPTGCIIPEPSGGLILLMGLAVSTLFRRRN